jgi:aryl-phospho-beta-D-glucosidase BglC (GH1 family)
MHQYLDTDGSGTSEACVSSTIGQERVREATQWLKANGKRAILGETAGGANAQCIAALTGMLSYMASNSDVWTGWYVNPPCALFVLFSVCQGRMGRRLRLAPSSISYMNKYVWT